MKSAAQRLDILCTFISKNCQNLHNNIMEAFTVPKNQSHLLEHYNSLTGSTEKENFMKQVKGIDFDQVDQLYKDVYLHHKNNEGKEHEVKFEPLAHVLTRQEIEKNSEELDEIGLKSVANGEVSVCSMSGGQGTRLGFDHPKGMFNIGLDLNFTLFEFFARKLIKLGELAKSKFPEIKSSANSLVKWYIMTSEMNNEEIITFFKDHNYFGYNPQSIFFFPQGGIPALFYDGKVVIESEGNISLAPGGNGAMYIEMKNKGALKHMRDNGVKYIYITPIDNVLLKLADPTCVGYLVKNSFDIVSTYVKKAYPEEKIGVHVLNNGKVSVCEYSEMPKELTEKKEQNGDLTYCHGNRATILITVDFVEKITTSTEIIQKINRKYHLAEKKIKYFDPATKKSIKPQENNGIKFELFYFDVFEECEKFGLFETLRDEEFAPVKNATGLDSPESAKNLLRDLSLKWIKKAGIEIEGEGYIEIDPIVSYNGEGLIELVKEKYGGKIKLPIVIK